MGVNGLQQHYQGGTTVGDGQDAVYYPANGQSDADIFADYQQRQETFR